MSKTFEQLIERSYAIAAELKHELVTLEHLLASLLEDPYVQGLLSKCGCDYNEVYKANARYLNDSSRWAIVRSDIYMPRHTTLLSSVVKKAKTQSMFAGRDNPIAADLLAAIYGNEDSPAAYCLSKHGPTKERLVEAATAPDSPASELMDSKEIKDILTTYCVNLNERAQQGKVDPLIGRELEVENITQILARRQKNNAVLTGDPGVGKTVIVEGLAHKIVHGDVPDVLKDKTIWSLDVAGLVAGTKFRGDFEERVKQIIKALQQSPESVLFIDEIHMIMGAGNGGGGGSLDAANILKPALSRGEIRCIGSTTVEEFRKHFEKDRALVRRFQRLDIREPNLEDSKRILRGLQKKYEQHHNVTYDPSAIDAAVELSARYITDRFLPDKAIDIIDGAGAWQKIRPKELRETTITRTHIEREVSRVAKIPVTNVSEDDTGKLAHLEDDLKSAVFGQDIAIERVVNAVFMGRSGLKEADKMVGAFLFTGPSGSGKTEVAKQLAKTLGIQLLRFDMSEYQEKHTVSRLIGSPPGYVGYGDGNAGGGLLINALESNPYTVLLFDEIEKAHPDVYALFLQLMDNGMITSSNGKTVSARNSILIFTSNAGADMMEKHSIGFGMAKDSAEDAVSAIKMIFTPEFRNRLDAVVPFARLDSSNMARILDRFISELNALTVVKGVTIVFDQEAKDWLIKRGFDPSLGARPLKRVIQDHVKRQLSREMLFGKLKKGGAVLVHAPADDLEFEYLNLCTNSNTSPIEGEMTMEIENQ